MRRIRPRFDSLVESFDQIELLHPIEDALLVAITDDLPFGHLAVIPNRDGYHQVLAGIKQDGLSYEAEGDAKLAARTFDILERSALSCGFSNPDRVSVSGLFAGHRGGFLDGVV